MLATQIKLGFILSLASSLMPCLKPGLALTELDAAGVPGIWLPAVMPEHWAACAKVIQGISSSLLMSMAINIRRWRWSGARAPPRDDEKNIFLPLSGWTNLPTFFSMFSNYEVRTMVIKLLRMVCFQKAKRKKKYNCWPLLLQYERSSSSFSELTGGKW